MKKKLVIVLAMALVLVMALSFALLGCGEKKPSGDEDANKVTVTWYNGSSVLKSEKIDKGGKVSSWTPAVADDKAFGGWYKEASKTQAFDFDTIINEDTDIFADIYSNVYVEDTTSYYLIGTGAGDMKKAAWNHDNAAASLGMTKQDVANENVYSIDVTLYAGDMFQIVHDGAWDGQFGIGGIQGAEYCDGTNANDGQEYTAADKKCAQVLDAEGKVLFVGYDEYNNSFEVWNAILADEQDGVYTIKLHTFPNAPDKRFIEVSLKEKVQPLTETHKMYFIGTMNDWSTEYAEGSELALTKSGDGSVFTGILTITEEDYADWTEGNEDNTWPGAPKCAAFKVYNAISGVYYGFGDKNIFLPVGDYAVKYYVEDDAVEVEELGYYLVGTFVDDEGAAVNFSVKQNVTPAMDVEDGVASVTFDATDVTALGDFSWIADQGKPGVMAFKVVYGSEITIRDWYGQADGDNFYVAAGEHTVTFNLETKEITVD